VTVDTAITADEAAEDFSRGAPPHPASHSTNGIGMSRCFVI
jgi:hypothetical protein